MPVISRIGAAAARGFGLFGKIAAAVDAYFNYTTLLLPGNGTNGAQNNTFLDSSSNAFTITRNGNTTQGNFSPFSQTGWSSYIDDSSQYVSYGSSADFTFGTGDFTVEAWVFVSSAAASNFFNIFNVGGAAAGSYSIYVRNDGKIESVRYGDPGGSGISTGTINFNSWNHLAAVRSAGTAKLYINGTADSGATYSMGNITASAGETGRIWQTAQTATGYVSNLRVCKGTAVYTANFTPSTTPLTSTSQSASNCVLLTFQSNRFVDTNTATTAKTITLSGTPSIQAFSPFAPTAAWSASTNGGSGYFDGSGDYIYTPSNANQDFGTNATVECWAYITSSATVGTLWQYGIESFYNIQARIFINTNRTVRLDLCIAPGGNVSYFTTYTSTSTIDLNAWNHYAFVKQGSSFVVYVNGVSYITATNSGSLVPPVGSKTFTIGACTNSGSQSSGIVNYLTGYIADFRETNTAVYTTSFTPPTAPLTAISGTQVLLSATNGGIVDATAKNDLETVGNAQISTTQSKFGGSSMYFDGTGDYLVSNAATPNLYAFGTGDFTIECWARFNSLPGNAMVYDGRPSGTSTTQPCIYVTSGGTLVYFANGGNAITSSAGAISTNTWYHIAVSRSGTSTKMFLGGTQAGSTYTDSTSYTNTAQRPVIGVDGALLSSGYLDGYIDDLRVTKGVARYTANFTPPTTAFPIQ